MVEVAPGYGPTQHSTEVVEDHRRLRCSSAFKDAINYSRGVSAMQLRQSNGPDNTGHVATQSAGHLITGTQARGALGDVAFD
jgi:hypothetical protein